MRRSRNSPRWPNLKYSVSNINIEAQKYILLMMASNYNKLYENINLKIIFARKIGQIALEFIILSLLMTIDIAWWKPSIVVNIVIKTYLGQFKTGN